MIASSSPCSISVRDKRFCNYSNRVGYSLRKFLGKVMVFVHRIDDISEILRAKIYCNDLDADLPLVEFEKITV